MHCETRVGNYNGDIGELARQYSNEFIPVPFGNPDVHKYGLIIRETPDTYFLMVSNSEDKGKIKYPLDYNVIATIFGKDKERVNELMQDFEKGFGIALKPAPKFLKERYDILAALFERMNIIDTLVQIPPQTVYCSGNDTKH